MNKIIRLYRLNRKKVLIAAALLIPIVFTVLLLINLFFESIGSFGDPGTGLIVIDPGHGGIDGGTTSGGFLEKEINLSIALRLEKLLKQKGFKVVLTRDRDESLEDLSPDGGSRHQRDLSARAAIINAADAQLFLSIHVNSNVNNPRACGSVVYYGTRFVQSEVLAGCIQHSLNCLETGGAPRDAHATQKGNFFILNMTRMPGVLIETAFITNYDERLLLATDEYRDGIASAIADGVTAYFEKLGIDTGAAAGRPEY